MKCPQCNTDNAAQLLTSWLCINNECSNFDPQHVQEHPLWKEFLAYTQQQDLVREQQDHAQLQQKQQQDYAEQQLKMQLVIASMEDKPSYNMSDIQNQMQLGYATQQLERVRQAAQVKMTEMKSDLQPEPDPFEEAVQDYLQRRLQTDIIKELNQAQKDAIAEMLFDG